MLSTLEVVTTVAVGLMVGVEFSVIFVMNRILNALPGDSGQLGHAHGGRMLGALMPFWYMGSVALSAIWAVAGWRHQGTGLVVTAAGLLVLSVVMSILLLVPINNRNKTWTPREPARRLAGAAGALEPLPLSPPRRHPRRVHPAGHRPRLTPSPPRDALTHPREPGMTRTRGPRSKG